MGLLVSIYRDDYDSTRNAFHGKRQIVMVDLDGPFDPTDDAPGAFLDRGPFGDPFIRPLVGPPSSTHAGPTFGGTYAATSDSRFGAGIAKLTGVSTGRFGYHAAIPIHDRFDTWSDFDRLTR